MWIFPRLRGEPLMKMGFRLGAEEIQYCENEDGLNLDKSRVF
jgi:hypothetical protein